MNPTPRGRCRAHRGSLAALGAGYRQAVRPGLDTMIITREQVRSKLRDWRDGKISTEEIFEWAGSLYPNTECEYEDREGKESNSVTNEVLAALDMVNINLNIPEDAEIFLEFLSAPLGEFESAYAFLQRRLNSIEYDLRRKTLCDNPLYAPFLSTNQR